MKHNLLKQIPILKLSLLSTLLLIYFSANSQNESVSDSLINQLDQVETDQEKLTLYQEIVKHFIRKDSAKATQYAQEGIALAAESGFENSIVDINYELAKHYMYHYQHTQADSLYGLIISASDKTGYGKGKGYLGRGTILYRQSNYQKAISMLKMAKTAFSEVENQQGSLSCSNQIGGAYYRLGLYDSAIFHYNEVLSIGQANNNNRAMGAAQSNLGLIYAKQGKYKEALQMHLSSLDNYKAAKWERPIIIANINIGMSYFDQEDYETSLIYLTDALQGAENIQAKETISTVLANIGDVHQRLKKYPEAIEYYKKSLKVSFEIGEELGANITHNTIGKTYFLMKDYEQARNYLSKALEAANRLNAITLKSQTLIPLGRVEYALGNLKKAESMLTEGVELARKNQMLGTLADGLKTLSQVYESNSQYDQSLQFFKQYHTIYDSILGENKSKEIADLQVQHETEKKEQEIESLNQQTAIQSLELRESNLYLTIMGIILVILALLSFILYLYNQKKRLALEQNAQNIEQRLLRSQMNPHFIFNAMTAVQRQITDGNTAYAEEYLTKFSRLIRQVLENSRAEFIPLDQEIEMLENYLKLHQASSKFPFQYEIIVGPEIDAEDLNIPPMFAQPFVENAIEHGVKHLGANGKVRLEFKLKDDVFVLSVADNGSGIERQKETTYKTHKSLAIQITKERIDILKKQMKRDIEFVVNQLDPGTEVIFNLPFKYS